MTMGRGEPWNRGRGPAKNPVDSGCFRHHRRHKQQGREKSREDDREPISPHLRWKSSKGVAEAALPPPQNSLGHPPHQHQRQRQRRLLIGGPCFDGAALIARSHQLVTARAKFFSSCSLVPESSAPGASASNVDSNSGSSNSSSSSSDLSTGGEGVALGAAGEEEAEVTPCESNVTEGIMCSTGLPRRYIRQAGCGTWFEVSLAVSEGAEMGEAGRTEARAAGRPFLTAAFREHWENSGIPAVEATLVAACACAAATTKGS